MQPQFVTFVVCYHKFFSHIVPSEPLLILNFDVLQTCSDPPPLAPVPTPTSGTGLTVTVPIVNCSDKNGPIR